MATTSATAKMLTITNPACLVEGSDSEFRHLVNGLLPFAARLLSVRDGFGSLIGLTGVQYSLLRSISHLSQKGEVSVNQLGDHLHLSGPFITIETNKLKELGLIEKKPHPDDKRKMRLTITARGTKLLGELLPVQQQINDVLFDSITKSEFKMLCSVVDRLVANGDRAALDLEHLKARKQKG
ncbi:MarR family winged helix-turn-helix transcriptional regulator [Cupriavidus consociatus]|uniref:MarR family winged helix-turn-helix transcriptional regulator n=1 Tax=Cupriavidus consociatus TaxID=2821357 RepID=UPI001AE1401F|nr:MULTISPECIES: MarR family transcriptional regulator [unclassified Cupriavidus]MBP0622336.1 MarR family transcriptional regulator [Cupriavidus sp. LEh25]MDK2659017.1 MarR family transcriptional regulator [Cupriavidus sp. LEh21]